MRQGDEAWVDIVNWMLAALIKAEELGVTNGFDFLDRSTGWRYSFSLLERSIDDPSSKTLLIGFLNTLFVGFISIFFVTILGFAIGTMRDSRNLALQAISSVYVQIFRNISLILQIVFLYAILTLPLSVVSGVALGSILIGGASINWISGGLAEVSKGLVGLRSGWQPAAPSLTPPIAPIRCACPRATR